MASCFSLTALAGNYHRRSFITSGLIQQTIDIDDKTTIQLWRPKSNSSKNRPSLLLLHGFGPIAIWQWRQQVISLSSDFDIYVPDLVFFGGSTTKCMERSEVFQGLSIGKMMEKLGVERYYVMGTSYGGFVAYRMAAMWPERVEKVVIASSAVNMVRGDNIELMERGKVDSIEDLMLPASPANLRSLITLATFNPPFLLPDFLLNDFITQLYSENRKEKMELLKGLTLGLDITPNISTLPQEVLIIWGDHDQIFPLKKATLLKGLLGEKARLEVIKNTSHVPQMEQPTKFNKIVKEFLCGLST